MKNKTLLFINIIFCLIVVTFVAIYPLPRTISRIFPIDEAMFKDAKWWQQDCLGVQCKLCPFRCFLPEGSRGICRVRMNVAGTLRTLVYAQPVSVHVDPMEKKPVYHMLPGSKIFSIATVGCNLRCSFCQNWEISQSYPEQAGRSLQLMTPEQVVDAAIRNDCKSIAYTYSEPSVFFEYVLDTAKLAKENGLRNVLVSAGYINPGPLKELAPYFDVIKIDLKGFNRGFYRRVVCGNLEYVLATLKELHDLKVLTEVVNLIVPTLNDDMADITRMSQWIYDNLGPDTPVFFSRFGPQYRLANLPPTPIETLEEARDIAIKTGLRYVYIGNVSGHIGENTYCPYCGKLLIHRYGYEVLENNIKDGKCSFCGKEIPGIWD